MFFMICLIVVVLAKVVICPVAVAHRDGQQLSSSTKVDASHVSPSQRSDPMSGKFDIATKPYSRAIAAKLCS